MAITKERPIASSALKPDLLLETKKSSIMQQLTNQQKEQSPVRKYKHKKSLDYDDPDLLSQIASPAMQIENRK